MRVSVNTFWASQNSWKDFFDCEIELYNSIVDLPIVILSTYPTAVGGVPGTFEVAVNHKFNFARRQRNWALRKTQELRQAKAEIKELKKELLQREDKRAYQPTKADDDLRNEIAERKKAEDELRAAYQRLSYHVENTPLAVIEFDKDLCIKRWSKRAEEIFGWDASEALGKNVYDPDFPIIYKEDAPAVNRINFELTKGVVTNNLSITEITRKAAV